MAKHALPQPMRPAGMVGRIFGWTMDLANAAAFRAAIAEARPGMGDRLLEIGFGTGALVKRLLDSGDVALVAGVDPSPLMVATARRRNRVAVDAGIADLREGTAAALPWPGAYFETALALHSFQFWGEPSADLAEVRRVLRPAGRLILVLRAHDSRPPAWLPNPVSRSGNEIDGTLDLLGRSGFVEIEKRGMVGRSTIVTARREG